MKTEIKPSRTIILTLSILSFITYFSGIIRHDIPENKYLRLAKQKQFDCVGQIFTGTSGGSCILITDKFVLSAAHIFLDSDTKTDTLKMDGKSMITFSPLNIRVTDVSKIYILIKGQKVKAKKLTLHPAYLDSLTKGSCDIALIELEQPLKNILPAKLNTAFDELNSNVVGVGYGVSGPADRPDLVAPHNKKIAGENVVDSLSGAKYSGYETLMLCDLDHPSKQECNKMGSSQPKPLEYVCSGGDSGGGLFRQKNNTWELIGVCSGSNVDITILMKTGYYGQTMRWTRVSLFTEWINQQ